MATIKVNDASYFMSANKITTPSLIIRDGIYEGISSTPGTGGANPHPVYLNAYIPLFRGNINSTVDYEQASERCYRIGQDTDVYIYKLVLDTGDEPNLSTRMQDILSWSKDQFGQIVDGEETIPEVALSFIQKLDNPTEDVLTFFKDTIKKFKF